MTDSATLDRTKIGQWYERYLAAHNVDGIEIPFTAIKFYKQGEDIPAAVSALESQGVTVTSCQATKQASLGDAVTLTKNSIGCVAAAISLGLVDANQDSAIQDSTVYTDIMREQSGKGADFAPPSPKDFTEGTVYACAAAGRADLGLFGADDVGRFKDVATAKTAIANMIAIQPATMAAVFLYSPQFTDIDLVPDVVVLSVRPIELTRLIQGYWFLTGEHVISTMGGLRMVNSDLIARPYLTGEINTSPYCLGARLIAQFGPDRMGVGMPWEKFQAVVTGMEESKGGYPFQAYPGADANA